MKRSGASPSRAGAIDIGGTGVRVGLVDENGNVSHVSTTDFENRSDVSLIDLIGELWSELPDGPPVAGIAVPGYINEQYTQPVECDLYPEIATAEFVDRIAEVIETVRILVENDVTSATVAVAMSPRGGQHESLAVLVAGTGSAVGVVRSGVVDRGYLGTSAEARYALHGHDGMKYHSGYFFPELYGISARSLIGGLDESAHDTAEIQETIFESLVSTVRLLAEKMTVDAIAVTGGISHVLQKRESRFLDIVSGLECEVFIHPPDEQPVLRGIGLLTHQWITNTDDTTPDLTSHAS